MPRHPRILVVEDDAIVLEQLAGVLADEGYEVLQAASAEAALGLLQKNPPHLLITDLKLPGASGVKVVEESRRLAPQTPVLVITAYASIETAVQVMRLGAFHYLQKPLSAEGVLAEVEKALEHGEVLREREALRERLSLSQGLGRLQGESPALVALRELIRTVARSNSTVLITGETGTGKELVADALHFESRRAGGPLVKVNCAALAESLLDSELFGHEKGAFTGADRRREGRFERADGGTLFLDEISEMGAHVQAKLLRVLQGEPFERVGGNEPLHPDVRLIAATNREPEAAVAEGKLRQDLFYRLDIVRVAVPPLRERLADVPLLAAHFLERYAPRNDRKLRGFTEAALTALQAHNWPGNVRELENCVARAALLARGETIDQGDLPRLTPGVAFVPGASPAASSALRPFASSAVLPAVPPAGTAAPASGHGAAPAPDGAALNLEAVEKQTILRALAETGWNKARAAERLGIFSSSLYKKMKRFGISQQKPE